MVCEPSESWSALRTQIPGRHSQPPASELSSGTCRESFFRQAPQAILSALLLRTTEVRGGERNTGVCSFTAELRANIIFSLPATLANVQWFFILRTYYLTFFSPRLLVYQQLQTKPRLLPVALGTLVGGSYKIIFRSWSSHENPHLWICLLKCFAFPDCGFCDILSQTIVLFDNLGTTKITWIRDCLTRCIAETQSL